MGPEENPRAVVAGGWSCAPRPVYKLRCDWTEIADEEHLKFTEIAPGS
jgi:hypothetical protein